MTTETNADDKAAGVDTPVDPKALWDSVDVNEPKTDKQEEVVETKAEGEPAKETPKDDKPEPTAEELKNEVANLRNRLRVSDGKAGGYQKAYQDEKAKTEQLQSEIAAAKAAPTQAGGPSQEQIKEAAKSPDKWAALKNEFGEWGDGVEDFVSSRLEEVKSAFQKEAEALRRELAEAKANRGVTPEERDAWIADAEKRIELNRNLADLTDEHPTWRDTVASEDFKMWCDRQPPSIADLAGSVRAKDAIKLLNLYEESKKPPPILEQRQQRLHAAASLPSGDRSLGTRQIPFEQMSPQDQWKYA